MLNSLYNIESSFFYVDDLSILKANRDNILGNQFIISPFSYNYTEGNNTISGISYELYYIDEDKNFNQLTYTFKEGNGLYIDENLCVNLNIDNISLIDNENNELSINEDNFSLAYYDNKGILHASDNLYVNDILMDKINNVGSMYSDNGKLSLNKGLITDLKDIINYYNNCQKISDEINYLYGVIINRKFYFRVGDYLYKNSDGVLTEEKPDYPYNDPVMICVIASNVLPDGYARFTLIKNRNDSEGRFAINSSKISFKNAFSNIPVYKNDYKNIVSENETVVGAKGGYFALFQMYNEKPNWRNNLINKFNNYEAFSLPPYETSSVEFLEWFIDKDYVNVDELYKINKGGVFSKTFTFNASDQDKHIVVNAKVEFKDGFIGKYLFTFDYDETSKKFELTNDCLPLDIQEKENPTYNNQQNPPPGNYYYFSLSMNSGLFDLDKVYISCALSKDENCTSWYDPEYLEYDNEVGLFKRFELVQPHNKGGIKILCYGSRYKADIIPYSFGIFTPIRFEVIAGTQDGSTKYYDKNVLIQNDTKIELNINKYIPVKLYVLNHVDDSGEIRNYHYMLNHDGQINTGNYDVINLIYTFDMSYISSSNDNKCILNTGCIKINRNDKFEFDFTQAQADVRIRIIMNNDYYNIVLNDVIFKINNNTLESQNYEINNYTLDIVQSVEINKFTKINDAQTTTIDKYEFSNQANILNN